MASIAILYGGQSSEHEISCISAAAVLSQFPKQHSPIPIGITREGAWHIQSVPSSVPNQLSIDTRADTRVSIRPGGGLTRTGGSSLPVDTVLPVLHGENGEDGVIQGVLEAAGLPYAGSGVTGSAVGMDKDLSKRIWKQGGLPVVPWKTFRAGQTILEKEASRLFEELGPVLFVKPAGNGSSRGVTRVTSPQRLPEALKDALRFDRKVLVEQAIKGRELECAVMGHPVPRAYGIGEVIPGNRHEFYDYDAKYTDPQGARLIVPANLSESETLEISQTAVSAHTSLEAEGFSRVDFLMDEKTGILYINEINTMPGLTSISLFPRMLQCQRIDFTAMLNYLIDDSLTRFRERRSAG